MIISGALHAHNTFIKIHNTYFIIKSLFNFLNSDKQVVSVTTLGKEFHKLTPLKKTSFPKLLLTLGRNKQFTLRVT